MIGIIGAMKNEVEGLKNAISEYRQLIIAGILFYRGKIGTSEVVITQCGVGKVNAAIATSLLISEFECHIIINTGIAGGTELVEKEDIVIGTRFAYFDVDATLFGYEFGQIPGSSLFFTPNDVAICKVKKALQGLGFSYKCGTILSGDTFVSKKETYEKMKLDDVMACEMEGCAIAHTCTKFKTAFIVIRYISDVIGCDDQIADYQLFEDRMAKRSSAICLEIVNELAKKI